jgi:hypothetical protein
MTNPIFFGLSTIIHLLVIAWHALVGFVFPSRKRERIMRQRTATRALSIVYVIAVSAFVGFCGTTILYASFVEPHSSVRAIEEMIPQQSANFAVVSSYVESLATLPAPTAAVISVKAVQMYGLLFAILLLVFLFAIQNPQPASRLIGSMQRKLNFRPLFVSIGISMFCIGTLSAFLAFTPATTAASYVLSTLHYVETFAR